MNYLIHSQAWLQLILHCAALSFYYFMCYFHYDGITYRSI